MELFFGCSTAADCAALTRKSDLFYNLTKQLLGADVAVIQYNRGAVEQRKGLNHAAQTMTHDVAGPAWSEWPGCECYTPALIVRLPLMKANMPCHVPRRYGQLADGFLRHEPIQYP